MRLSVATPAPRYPGNSRDVAGTWPGIDKNHVPAHPGHTRGVCGDFLTVKWARKIAPGLCGGTPSCFAMVIDNHHLIIFPLLIMQSKIIITHACVVTYNLQFFMHKFVSESFVFFFDYPNKKITSFANNKRPHVITRGIAKSSLIVKGTVQNICFNPSITEIAVFDSEVF